MTSPSVSRTARPRGQATDTRGAALIVVLVCLLSISGLVLGNAQRVVSEAESTRFLAAEYQTDLIAESLVLTAIEAILADEDTDVDLPTDPWTIPITGTMAEETIRFRIRITPENEYLALNPALTSGRHREAVRNLTQLEGAASGGTETLLDWLDDDAKERIPGSETLAYNNLFPTYGPANTQAVVPEEILMVPGFMELDPDWVGATFSAFEEVTNLNLNFTDQEIFTAFFPELASSWESILSWRYTDGFTDVSQLREAVPSLTSNDNLYTEIIKYLEVKSDIFRVQIEVETPFVYQKRRYILRRDATDTQGRPSVARRDVLLVIPAPDEPLITLPNRGDA